MSTIRLSNFNQLLATRWMGALIRNEIEKALDASADPVVVDASGVRSMSHSFADECFGKLAEQRGLTALLGRMRIENVAPDVLPVVRYVISARSRRAE